jgi:DNA modification methylase
MQSKIKKIAKSNPPKWGVSHDVIINTQPKKWSGTEPVYRTGKGRLFCGDSSAVLSKKAMGIYNKKAQLIFTSPPFPLNTKKRYGNLQGEEYIEWFSDFAPLLKKFLKPDGSIVVEIGNCWERGRPVMSTVVLRALLRFLERGGLKLCQEFVWYNPARLPSPVQWVNVERIRVKDAFTRIWWMSPSDRPKADNRRVLREYSESMKRLIASGKYNAGARPSQHNIGKHSFKQDNKGAIPPNVIAGENASSITALLNGDLQYQQADLGLETFLKGSNTRSQENYLEFCRARGLQLHPARMPYELVEFFIRFLTTENDLVLDPFGGSNTTGSIAESLGRKWISVEANWNYATSSIGRFDPTAVRSACKALTIKKLRHAAASESESSVLTPSRIS